ncbi:MAG: ThiF family adenylyltransferase, partial [Tolypothrix sp. Co-bin9]|nr:ThiF family adenylyltransferase [Tolypothrix sp. Co-bin9]
MDTPKLDTSYLQALTFLTPSWQSIDFILVGCGGTGSHVAYAIARLLWAVEQIFPDRKAVATFVDPDIVEAKNIARQLFCHADIGRNKAQVLASRLSLSLGINIGAIPKAFSREMIGDPEHNKLVVIIGCVDNAEARSTIANCLSQVISPKKIIWIDGGNHEQSGQVLLGNTPTWAELEKETHKNGFCSLIPSPALIHPELLLESKNNIQPLSCAELALLNTQSFAINIRVAAEINDYLRGVTFGGLKKYAT